MLSRFSFLALAAFVVFASGASAQDALVGAPQLYPNPVAAGQTLSVVSDAPGATVEVIDMLGRQVDASALAAGTYLARLSYADGRVSTPSRFTMLSAGALELRVVSEATAPLAPEANLVAAPLASAIAKAGGCAPGQVVFGGFYFDAAVGQLRRRPNATPPALVVRPVISGGFANLADISTCFGDVQGTSFRYTGAAENRPLRIVSPPNTTNTSLTYEVSASELGAPFTIEYGLNETAFDDDGNAGTPDAAGAEFLLSTPFFAGLGLYELIVLNDDNNVVYRAPADGVDGLYISGTTPNRYVNVLNATLYSSAVDGYEFPGGTKPGDVSFVFELESSDGSLVNVHVGENAPVATGRSIHITPKFDFTNPWEVVIHSIRTRVTGMNRFGIRALRFASGSNGTEDALWARNSQEYFSSQSNTITDAQDPSIFVGNSPYGTPSIYGLRFGREPQPVFETASDVISVSHSLFGGTPVTLDDDGEYYRAIADVRNIDETQNEVITAQFENDNASNTLLTVTNTEGTFATYEFVYDANGDGTANIRATYAVGATISFGPSGISALASETADDDDQIFDLGSTQDYSLTFLVQLSNGSTGTAYVFPDFATPNSNVDIRRYTVEANQPYTIDSTFEADLGVPPSPLRGLVHGLSTATK